MIMVASLDLCDLAHTGVRLRPPRYAYTIMRSSGGASRSSRCTHNEVSIAGVLAARGLRAFSA
jgi:hypothetical protein